MSLFCLQEGRDKQFLLNKLQEQEQKLGKKNEASPLKKVEQPVAQASEKITQGKQNPRSNDPGEGSFSPPHVVDNPEW